MRSGMMDTILGDMHEMAKEFQTALKTAGWEIALEDVVKDIGWFYLWSQGEITLVRLVALLTGDHVPTIAPAGDGTHPDEENAVERR